jgi:hypothetical protein
VSVQLHADHDTWVRRFEAEPRRPGLNDFYQSRYAAAQATPADHVVDTGGIAPEEVARRVAALIGIIGQEKPVADQPSSRHET